MTIENTTYVLEREKSILVGLHDLLERQLRLAQKGDIAGVESLGKKTDSIIEIIIQGEVFERADFQNQREKIQKLYGQLSVALSAQKAEMTERVNQIRKGRKTLGTYLKNI